MAEKKPTNSFPWLNPLGGLGDTLLISGVLKQIYDKNPDKKFNLIRRTKYFSLLNGHPAIAEIGFPPKDAQIIGTDYWTSKAYSDGTMRPFQILADKLGLETPVEEKLFLAGELVEDTHLKNFIPWRERNVIIAPNSDSPRKMMPPMAWHILVEQLLQRDIFVVQVGKMFDMHIKGAYSLLGITSPRELIYTLTLSNLVITTDNFVMHAAHLVNKPIIAVWGPTNHKVYGYEEQVHFQAPMEHCQQRNECLGPRFPQNYATQCPLNQEHCMTKIHIPTILKEVERIL